MSCPQAICAKVFQTKRKVFNSKAHRLEGLPSWPQRRSARPSGAGVGRARAGAQVGVSLREGVVEVWCQRVL